jgi:DNA-binding XRE family transcriptional regulator
MSRKDSDTYKPVSHAKVKARAFKDPKFRAEYERIGPDYELLDVLLAARKQAGMTQREVAEAMGVKHPSVARLESSSATHSPGLRTLRKYAEAVGCELKITFTPKK